MTPAWSTTRPVSDGKSNAQASPQMRQTSSMAVRCVLGRAGRSGFKSARRGSTTSGIDATTATRTLELHLRGRLCALVRRKFCHRLAAKDSLGPNDAWEGSDLGVISAHRVDIVT